GRGISDPGAGMGNWKPPPRRADISSAGSGGIMPPDHEAGMPREPAGWKPALHRRRHVFYLHPLMAPRLRQLGLRDDEMTQVSYGLEIGPTEAVPEQTRVYDAVWIGR